MDYDAVRIRLRTLLAANPLHSELATRGERLDGTELIRSREIMQLLESGQFLPVNRADIIDIVGEDVPTTLLPERERVIILKDQPGG